MKADLNRVRALIRPIRLAGSRILGIDQRFVFLLIFGLMFVPYVWFLWDGYHRLDGILIRTEIGLPAVKSGLRSQALLTSLEARALPVESIDVLARTALEHDTLMLRHERASASLAMRTWLRFMSLIFGAILVLIGSAFVMGRISDPKAESSLSGEGPGLKLAVKSTYPGLVLASLGALLIAVPNLAQQSIEVNDTSSFFGRPPVIPPSADVPVPPVPEQELVAAHNEAMKKLSELKQK
jgi:hypothetical protein